jgi:hypothetical protein
MFVSRYMISAAATFAGGAVLLAGALLALALATGTPIGFQTKDSGGRVVTLQPGDPAYDDYARRLLAWTLGGGGVLFGAGLFSMKRIQRGP